MRAAVIGSGIGGLAAAIRLANKGHIVTVFEKNELPGGKISQIRYHDYRFDTGPSLFTLPNLVEELFLESKVEIQSHFGYTKLPTVCKYFYPDKTELNFYQDREKLLNELEIKTTENSENLIRHLNKARESYNLSANIFIFNSLHKVSNFLSEPYKKILFKLHKLDFFRTMHRANYKRFSDYRIVQLFDRYATYNGSNPYQAPATLNMIAHLENNIGAFFPKKGMYSLVQCLYELAKLKGVKFQFNTYVEAIVIKGKKAVALRIENSTLEYDTIISDADIRYLANNMLKHPYKNRINRLQPSSSALIFCWGIKKKFPELEIHNILFSKDYPKEFRRIFKEKTLIEDPTVYISISSKIVISDAPPGCENWFVMINAPSNSGQNWDKIVATARKNIILKINSRLNTDIEKYIEFENISSPVTIEQKTLSLGGALYGNSSNSIFSAFLRHPNFLRGIRHLYFVGGSVHPGGGIPLCLASAKIVDQEIPKA